VVPSKFVLKEQMIAYTCIINSSKQEFIYIGGDYPAKVGKYLARMEPRWSLKWDEIFIVHDYGNPHGFKLIQF